MMVGDTRPIIEIAFKCVGLPIRSQRVCSIGHELGIARALCFLDMVS